VAIIEALIKDNPNLASLMVEDGYCILCNKGKWKATNKYPFRIIWTSVQPTP
jgi:hypothetical protein